MKQGVHLLCLALTLGFLAACGEATPSNPPLEEAVDPGDYERGPNNGRMLIEDDFAIELAIFETGVPPEFRAWVTEQGSPVAPRDIDLVVTLTRLGDVRDVIRFLPMGEALRGDTVIYEPHSFYVAVEASYQNKSYSWQYESLEGRTTILPGMISAFGIETETAGATTLQQTLSVIGTVKANEEFSRSIRARFDGSVQSVSPSIGSLVQAGDALVTIESNQSLLPYTITSPISGVVTERNINPGEQSTGQVLFSVLDTSRVWAELAIHPNSRQLVRTGARVTLSSPLSDAIATGTISNFKITVEDSQAVVARVLINNDEGDFPPGSFVEGKIDIAQIEVPLAVKRSGLQPFRDFTVVFAKVDDTYEVRMLELGRQDETWVEVLGGLDAGTEYVTTNSYVLKADVEKSGASHDH
jgi:cobalt-zinc-cadmium efflux system membrane fusion protein